MRAKPTIVYTYRGQIETGPRYRWMEGYSETSAHGGALYPWMGKRACQADAKARGARAVFAGTCHAPSKSRKG